MKAIRVHQFGGPEVLLLERTPDPVPGQGEVLVQVRAAGVNPVEAYIRTGTYAFRPSLPYTPGADGAGIVEAVGGGVSKVKPGDRVYLIKSSTGTYAQKALAPEEAVFLLPEGVSFEQGAALGVPYGTAHRALFHRGGAKAGETVLVHGATGGVGTAAVQLARKAGLTVLATGGTGEGRQLVLSLGAHQAFDHRDPEEAAKILQATGGRGVDLVLEMLANVNLAKDLTLLAKFGRVVVVGNRGPIEVNMREAMGRDADIRAMTLFNATPGELASIHADLGLGLRDGSLKPVIGRKYPLPEASRAHKELMEPGALGKAVLVPEAP